MVSEEHSGGKHKKQYRQAVTLVSENELRYQSIQCRLLIHVEAYCSIQGTKGTLCHKSKIECLHPEQ